MSALSDIRPFLQLFYAERRNSMLAGVAFAVLTLLAGMALLGVSGWFITATAFAGLSASTAVVFDVFAPSAAIRLLALSRTAGRYAERLTTHEATLDTLAALRERLFRGWAGPQAARRLALRPATLLHRLTADIDALESLYLRLLVPACTAIASALALAFGLGLMQPLFGLVAGLWLALFGAGVILYTARSGRSAARRRGYGIESLRARTIDLVAGQQELAMVGRLPAQRAAVARADTFVAEADDRLNWIETRAGLALGLCSAAILPGALLGGALLVGNGTLSLPWAVFATLFVMAATEPFAALRRGAAEYGRTLRAAARLAPRLQAEPGAPGVATPAEGVAVTLDAVVFRHEAGGPPFGPCDMRIGRGEHVALVGASGAGKSTLLALVAGELAPLGGDVSALPSVLMTQRTELFADTLAGNLRLADRDADDARLWQALEAAGLADDLRSTGRGLETQLGEGGAGLSQGQARRFSLARLFLRDAPLWLLDEPTESVDAATARDLLARLKGRADGRAILMATHSRREAAIVDRVIVIRAGRVAGDFMRGEVGFATAVSSLRPD